MAPSAASAPSAFGPLELGPVDRRRGPVSLDRGARILPVRSRRRTAGSSYRWGIPRSRRHGMARRRGGNESQPRRPGTQRAPASVPVGTAPATRRAVGVRYNRNGSSGWAAVPIVSAMGPRSVLLATLVSVALAACGGGGSSSAVRSSSSVPASTTTTSGVAKDSYILQANAICADMNSQVRAAASTSADPGVQASSIDHIASITRGALQRLRALPTPPGDAGSLSGVYADVDKVLSDAGQLAPALRAGDVSAARRISQTLSEDSRAANRASNTYGLTVCGATT